MDLVLVFPLILAFLSTGESHTSNSCYAKCPAGYHKVGECEDPAAKHKCQKCNNNTFTAVENTILKCLRCDTCGHYEVVRQPCSFNHDVECDCKDGYYNANNAKKSAMDCQPCPSKDCKSPHNKKCQSCLGHKECRMKCMGVPVPPSPNPTTAIFRTSASGITASSRPPNPSKKPVPKMSSMSWLVFFGVVTLVLLFWLLLVCTRNPLQWPDSCPRWSANKDLFLEQHSHQGSSPTMLTVNISEETPMMLLSQNPAAPEHPTHIRPVLPDTEHKGAKQDEQSEHWPAIVLYAIIKEVPLRRWKEFLRLLSVADQQLERVELEASLGLGSMERQYQMLRLWSQRSSASLNDVFSALHYMDLSGCAQLLQESLEKLQWRPEVTQGLAHHGFNRVMQDT